jgi:hypothetical protein
MLNARQKPTQLLCGGGLTGAPAKLTTPRPERKEDIGRRENPARCASC